MRQVICDRCGAVITSKVSAGYISMMTRNLKTEELTGNNEFEQWDLCDRCMVEIEWFIKNKTKPIEQKATDLAHPLGAGKRPTATIKKPISDGTKWSPLTPEKIEQIMQMLREGKTVKEVSEAAGVSDPTVRKYKKLVDAEKEAEVDEDAAHSIAKDDSEDTD